MTVETILPCEQTAPSILALADLERLLDPSCETNTLVPSHELLNSDQLTGIGLVLDWVNDDSRPPTREKPLDLTSAQWCLGAVARNIPLSTVLAVGNNIANIIPNPNQYSSDEAYNAALEEWKEVVFCSFNTETLGLFETDREILKIVSSGNSYRVMSQDLHLLDAIQSGNNAEKKEFPSRELPKLQRRILSLSAQRVLADNPGLVPEQLPSFVRDTVVALLESNLHEEDLYYLSVTVSEMITNHARYAELVDDEMVIAEDEQGHYMIITRGREAIEKPQSIESEEHGRGSRVTVGLASNPVYRNILKNNGEDSDRPTMEFWCAYIPNILTSTGNESPEDILAKFPDEWDEDVL